MILRSYLPIHADIKIINQEILVQTEMLILSELTAD